MRWCERAAGIPRESSVKFGNAGEAAHDRLRMSPAEWRSYSGWCGHQHVPEQFAGHWDPGAIDIKRLLAGGADGKGWPGAYLKLGDHSGDVKRAKFLLEQVRDPTKAGQPRLPRDDVFGHDMLMRTRQFQRHHGLDADGVIGPATWAALVKADAQLKPHGDRR
jgi:peptidoglycan hydrolase-like protein with peptidoglycan-binding domain